MPDTPSAESPGDRPTHEDLLARVALTHDRAAFASLFGHFAPRLKTWLMRMGTGAPEAEELAQEVMLAVWRRAGNFDPARASAGTWIFAIARNRCVDALRRGSRPEIDPEDPALVPAEPETAEGVVAAAQDRLRLAAAIGRLPDGQAALLRMAYFQEKAHGEIAEDTGLPLGTVKSRLRLALVRLRRDLDQDRGPARREGAEQAAMRAAKRTPAGAGTR